MENPLFEEFARSLQPMYNHVNRMTVEEDCLTFYENEKAKLKHEFGKLTSRVSLSLVTWWNPKENYYCFCIAAHFIDNNFKLVKKIIYIMGLHRGYVASAELERCVNDWGFGNRVLAVPTGGHNPWLRRDWEERR